MIRFNNPLIIPVVQFLACVTIYFNVSIYFPWEDYPLGTVSTSYIFDFIYWLGIALLLKQEPKLGIFKIKPAFLRTALVANVAMLACGISLMAELNSPFRYLNQLALKILILAPFFEEIVFRGAFYDLMTRIPRIPQKVKLLINALLFSFSHAAALLVLPKEFFGFVYYQLGYTLILGWICAKSRERSEGLAEPIILHFVFNLIFYIAITSYGL